MKKSIFLLIAFLLINAVTIAQDTIKIKGVPVQSKFDTFVREIKKKGFELIHEDDRGSLFSGTFMDELCHLLVYKSNGNVSDVAISLLHEYSSWYSIKNKSDDIVEVFTKRFGKPDRIIHRYEYPYEEGDGYELSALKLGKLTYIRCFSVGYYTIFVAITKNCNIIIQYRNDKEYQKKQDERINDI